MNGPYLCIGGPLDGQLRSCAGPVLRAALPLEPMTTPFSAADAAAPVDTFVSRVDYQLKLRTDGQLVWVCE